MFLHICIPFFCVINNDSGNSRIAFTTWKHYKKHDVVMSSGLVGPVIIRILRK